MRNKKDYRFLHRCILLSMVITICLLLSACAQKGTPKMEGTYYLSTFLVDGWNIADSNSTSSLKVSGIDNNTISTINLDELKKTMTISGPITTETKSDSMIVYKLWVYSQIGFSSEMKYIYLYYYPEEDIVKVNGNNDLEFSFIKHK